MPRRSVTPPRLCRHPSGQACVYVNGRARYLGKHGSAKAEDAYRAFVVEWASGRLGAHKPDESNVAPAGAVTVSMAMLRFWEWAERRYKAPDGSDTREAVNYRYALRPLRKLFGALPLAQLGPNRFREVQKQMVRDGLARQTVNRRMGRLRWFLRWCVSHELCPIGVYESAKMVESLCMGQGAREAPKRKPVAWETIESTLPHLSPLMRAYVLVLWHTGARVGEIRTLTTGMIDRTGDVWRADLAKHKTAHHGKERVILIGPQAQESLRPWLRPFEPDRPIFSPRRADGRSAKRTGPKAPGERYNRCGPAHAIARACAFASPHPTLGGKSRRKLSPAERADVTRWNASHRWVLAQLRHAKATALREQFGLDVAQVVLGHAKPTMTAHYSAAAIAHAVDAMRQAG